MLRPAGLLVAGGALVLAALAAAAHAGADPLRIEARVAVWAAGAPGWALPLSFALDALGGTLAGLALAAAGGALLARAGRRDDATVLVVGALVTLAASGLLKLLLARERPDEALVQLSDLAYPSGHAARAAFLACFAAGYAARWSPRAAPAVAALAALWALAVGASRLVLGVHRAYDVLGGWALGVAVWAGIALLLERRAAARGVG